MRSFSLLGFLSGLALASGALAPHPADRPLPVPPRVPFCFYLSTPEGYLGERGWGDYDTSPPICLPGPFGPKEVRVIAPDGLTYRFLVYPDYEGTFALEGNLTYLLLFGAPEEGRGRLLQEGRVEVALFGLPLTPSFPAGRGVATVPGLDLQVAPGSGATEGWLLFAVSGKALALLGLKGIMLYKDGRPREPEVLYMEVEGARRSYKGGVRLPRERGAYELRFYFAPDGLDGEEAVLTYSFQVR
jgi:hypothetical protein